MTTDSTEPTPTAAYFIDDPSLIVDESGARIELNISVQGFAADPTADPGGAVLLAHTVGSTASRVQVEIPDGRPTRAEFALAAGVAWAFTSVLDEVLSAGAVRESELSLAIESHRIVGQAVGVLVERHRLTPEAAFDRLNAVSQARNLRLRELALRLLETGLDPEQA